MRVLIILLLILVATASESLAASVRFEEDLVLDPAGTEAEFGRIAAVAVASDGTVYVADSGFGKIHAFDDEGGHERSFGTVGDGPGDLPRQIMRLAIDAEDHLVLTGSRTTIGWLDGTGDLVRSVEREASQPPHSLAVFEDGRILLTWTMIEWGADQVHPLMVHLLAPDGNRRRSFAGSTWWRPEEYSPRWASALVSGTAAITPDERNIVFVQSSPFELRRYDLEGELIAKTTEGAGDFVPEPRLPEVRGDTVSFRVWGGSGPPRIAPDGKIFLRASRVHPEDFDPSTWKDRDTGPRWQSRTCVYSPGLDLLAQLEGDESLRLLAFDPHGRLWCHGPDDLPTLIRFRVVWEE